jgi:hypothetical protein
VFGILMLGAILYQQDGLIGVYDTLRRKLTRQPA